MKVINLSDSTVFLDDISTPVIYSRQREPVEIPDALACKSINLKYAIKMNLLVDVTNGIPNNLPTKPTTMLIDQSSPYYQKKAMLATNDHYGDNIPDTLTTSANLKKKTEKEGEDAFENYRKTGEMSTYWQGPSTDHGGFSLMNKKFMFGLKKLGVKVRHDKVDSLPDVNPDEMRELNNLSMTQIPKNSPKIYGQTAPLHYDWDKYKMLFTMMETKTLHKDYTERCNCADEIIVPSRWCEQMFKESGVKKPIYVVPLGVDLDIYKPGIEPIAFTKKLKPFIFLSVFGWSLRKGYDVLLKAYLEEFTSDDPVTLLISSRYFGSTDESKKKVIRNDIARVSSTVQNTNKPQVVLFGDVLSTAMMPSLYAAASCYVLISRGEGWGMPYCCLPKTNIIVENLTKNIEDIVVGDKVQTHDGNISTVKTTMSREYSGKVIKIRAMMNNMPFACTPEHPFLVVKKQFKNSNDKRHLQLKQEWVKAGDVKKGDLLVAPAKPNTETKTTTIDLATFLDITTLCFDSQHIWSRYSNKPFGITAAKLAAASGVSQRQVYRVMEAKNKNIKIERLSEEKRLVVLKTMKRMKFKENSIVKVNRFIEINEEFAELAGLYTAEGSAMECSVSFSFHKKEIKLQKRTKELVKKIFGDIAWNEKKRKGNGYEIIFSSHILSKVLVAICNKYAIKKFMSPLMFNAKESVRMAFVDAFFEGDGHQTHMKVANTRRYHTSSRELAYQIWRILLCNEISSSIEKRKLRKNGKSKNNEYVVSSTINLKHNTRQRGIYRKTIYGDGFYLFPIRSVKTSNYDGKVYNFEVEGQNSYCVNGFAVHNCEAGACNIPVIASCYSGQTDFLNDENSYLVDVDSFAPAETSLAWISYFYENSLFPRFGPKAVEQTRYFMRRVFENPKEAKEKANKLYNKIVSEYGWDLSVQKMYEKLKQTFDKLS